MLRFFKSLLLGTVREVPPVLPSATVPAEEPEIRDGMRHDEIALIRDPERRAKALCFSSEPLVSLSGTALVESLAECSGYWVTTIRLTYQARLLDVGKPKPRVKARKPQNPPDSSGGLFTAFNV